MNKIRIHLCKQDPPIMPELRYAVIVSRYQEKWVLVKHRERMTWEIPGGHHEAGESIDQTAARELHEETGADVFQIHPIGIYSVEYQGKKTFGKLFFAEIRSFKPLPESEIETLAFFDSLPENLTYPEIQPVLWRFALEFVEKGVRDKAP